MKPGVPNGFQLIGARSQCDRTQETAAVFVDAHIRRGPKGVMIIGSPGGSRIPGMVILGTLIPRGQERAGDRERAAFPSPVLARRPRVRARSAQRRRRTQLEARGHKLREGSRKWGNTQVVTWDYKTGKVEAASDPRGVGEGLVY